MNFFDSIIQELIKDGNRVDLAYNSYCGFAMDKFNELGCKLFEMPWSREAYNIANWKSIGNLRKIIKDNKYDIVHCHTPIAAALTRLACRPLRKKGLKVIYTAHGFHFYKGAPIKNWLVFFPIEWLCSYWTDVLITINKEDYRLAKRHLHAKKVYYVPGVGINLEKFNHIGIDKSDKRKEIGVPDECLLLLSVGELNENKNHESVIRALSQLNDKNIYYAIAGKGTKANRLVNVAEKLGIANNVKLLGFRSDINELLEITDIYILPSFREGLNVSLMEAMASGLPCAVSQIRGNVDLICKDGGAFFSPNSEKECGEAIKELLVVDRIKMGIYNKVKIAEFDIAKVNKRIMEIYDEVE